MKKLRVLCLLSISTLCSADTFLGPSTEGHQIIVPTNKVIYIESIDYSQNISGAVSFRSGSNQVSWRTNQLNISTYVAGPGELIVPSGAWAQYTILDNFGFQTKYIDLTFASPAMTNIVFNLEAGQSIRWFDPIPSNLSMQLTLTDADQRSFFGNAINSLRIEGTVKGKVTGPMTVTFILTNPVEQFFTYEIVSGGTNRVVNIQKSGDLVDWQTVDAFPASDEPIVFYRLDAKLKQQAGN